MDTNRKSAKHRVSEDYMLNEKCDVCRVSGPNNHAWRDYLDGGGRVGFQVKVGVGRFERVTDIREGETVQAEGGEFHLKRVKAVRPKKENLIGIQKDPGLVLIKGEYDFDPDYQVVLQARSKDGDRVEATGMSGVGLYRRREGRRWFFHLPIAKADIEHFEIHKRPVQAHLFDELPVLGPKDLFGEQGGQTQAEGSAEKKTQG